MTRRRTIGIWVAGWLCLAGFTQQAQQFRTTVELVQLQVGVADAAGNFVSGLEPDDFVLTISGAERPVQVVYEVDRHLPGPLARVVEAGGAEHGEVADGGLPAAARRRFLLLFDYRFTPRAAVLRGRRAARQFVQDTLLPDDLVAVAVADNLHAKMVVPFTSRHDLVRRALDSTRPDDLPAVEDAPPPMEDADMAAIMAGSFDRRVEVEVRAYLQNLREVGRYLEIIEGRKQVVLLSAGFVDRLVVPPGSDEVRARMDEVIDAFRGANAVLHSVDPTGLRGFDPGLDSETGEPGPPAAVRDGHQSLLAMAAGTGGTVHWNTNEIAAALADVETATATYYVIGYRADPSDPPTVDVAVRVTRAGAHVVWAPSTLHLRSDQER